jgi:uncharacterized protein YndB with AHSA1/START domain
MSVTHDTISVTRELAAPIERVFHQSRAKSRVGPNRSSI